MSMGKKIGIAAGVVIALVVIALLLLPYIVNPESYRQRIVADLQDRLAGRTVEIGKMKLSVLTGLRLDVDKFVVREKPGQKAAEEKKEEEEAQAGEIDLSKGGGGDVFIEVRKFTALISPLSVFTGRIKINTVELNQPQINITRDEEGRLNISDLLGKEPGAKTETAPEQTPPAKTTGEKNRVTIDSIKIVQGQVSLEDRSWKDQEMIMLRAHNLDLSLSSIKPDAPLQVSLAASLESPTNDQNIKISGTIGPLGQTIELRNADVDLNVNVSSLQLGEGQRYYKKYLPVEIASGLVELNIKLKGKLSEAFDTDGEIKLHNLAYVDNKHEWMPSPQFEVALFEKMHVDTRAKGFDIQSLQGTAGPVPISISGSCKSLDQKQKDVALDIKADKFDVKTFIETVPPLKKWLEKQGFLLSGRTRMSIKIKTEENGRMSFTGEAVLDDNLWEWPDLVKKPVGDPMSIGFGLLHGDTSYAIKDARFSLGSLMATGAGKIKTGDDGSFTLELAAEPTNLEELGKDVPLLKKYQLGGNAEGTVKISAPFGRPKEFEVLIDQVTYRSSHSDATLSLVYRNPESPQVEYKLAAGTLDLDSIMAPPKEQPQENPEAEAEKKPEPKEQPSGKDSFWGKAEIKGELSIARLITNKLAILGLQANTMAAAGTLSITDISGQVAGGSLSGTCKWNLISQVPEYVITASVEKADVNKIISSLTSINNRIFGRGKMDLNVSGSSAEWKTAFPSLDGEAIISIDDGAFRGFDMVNGLLKQWAASEPVRNTLKVPVKEIIFDEAEETRVAHLEGPLTIKNAKMSGKEVTVDIARTNIRAMATAQGYIGFDSNLNIMGDLTFDESMSQLILDRLFQVPLPPVIRNIFFFDGKLVLPYQLKGQYPNLSLNLDLDEYKDIMDYNLQILDEEQPPQYWEEFIKPEIKRTGSTGKEEE